MEEKTTFKPFDLAHNLDSEEEIVEFLSAAFEEGDAAHIAHCLGIVARARNMAQLARDVGMSRPALAARAAAGVWTFSANCRTAPTPRCGCTTRPCAAATTFRSISGW